jgi:antitoxin component of RelBE/YafQ-DinJ toxin-antitoxin module
MTNANEPRISVILTPELKKQVDTYCDDMDITVSQLVRRLLKTHLDTYKITDGLEFQDE